MNGDKCGGGNINIGFIGAGAVGCSIGKYLCENSSIAKIKGYYSRTSKSVDIAATFTNSKAYALQITPFLLFFFPLKELHLNFPDQNHNMIRNHIHLHNMKNHL